MAKRYSQDLRDRVIDAVEREDVSRRAAARRYEISESVAVKWLERQKRPSSREWRSGSLRPCQRRTRAADALIAAARFATVLVQPTATIRGRADLQNPPRCVRRRPNPLPARDRLSDPAHARSVE